MKRRSVLALMAAALALPAVAAPGGPVMKVYKDAGCGCCSEWVTHLQRAGFTVSAENADMSVVRKKFSVPAELGSCHTAVVDGYLIEGHVPAREVRRLLAERPKARGLAVPGMPAGSPGMEGPRSDRYAVLLFDTAGRTSVYQRY